MPCSNATVRCLVMQSFLDVEWKTQGNFRNLFPEDFVLGELMQGLNDPVHHKDFGLSLYTYFLLIVLLVR